MKFNPSKFKFMFLVSLVLLILIFIGVYPEIDFYPILPISLGFGLIYGFNLYSSKEDIYETILQSLQKEDRIY